MPDATASPGGDGLEERQEGVDDPVGEPLRVIGFARSSQGSERSVRCTITARVSIILERELAKAARQQSEGAYSATRSRRSSCTEETSTSGSYYSAWIRAQEQTQTSLDCLILL